jgi:hypothetical protein
MDPEQEARQHIDDLLTQAGWAVQPFAQDREPRNGPRPIQTPIGHVLAAGQFYKILEKPTWPVITQGIGLSDDAESIFASIALEAGQAEPH